VDYISMASEEACTLSLGRSCKAKAKAKAKHRLFLAEYAEHVRARDAAQERRAELLEVGFNTAWHNPTASDSSPWADMGNLDATAERVVHSDTRREVSTSMAAGIGVPCTECHTQHRGVCTYHDLLLADLVHLKLFASNFVPLRPEFNWLLGALWEVIISIQRSLAYGPVTPGKFRELRASVVRVREQCYLYVLEGA
jgi:hypothetical protein